MEFMKKGFMEKEFHPSTMDEGHLWIKDSKEEVGALGGAQLFFLPNQACSLG